MDPHSPGGGGEREDASHDVSAVEEARCVQIAHDVGEDTMGQSF